MAGPTRVVSCPFRQRDESRERWKRSMHADRPVGSPRPLAVPPGPGAGTGLQMMETNVTSGDRTSMKRNPVAWAALIVASAALVSSAGFLRRCPLRPRSPWRASRRPRPCPRRMRRWPSSCGRPWCRSLSRRRRGACPDPGHAEHAAVPVPAPRQWQSAPARLRGHAAEVPQPRGHARRRSSSASGTWASARVSSMTITATS